MSLLSVLRWLVVTIFLLTVGIRCSFLSLLSVLRGLIGPIFFVVLIRFKLLLLIVLSFYHLLVLLLTLLSVLQVLFWNW